MSLLQIIKFNIFEHNHTLPKTFNNLKENCYRYRKKVLYVKMWLKNIFNKHSKVLNENQQIILLNNLNNLLKSGFTLLESFNFINLYFNYKNKDIANKIVKIIKQEENASNIRINRLS